MASFLTGLACAVVLAAGTYFLMEAGTITMVEKSNTVSTVIDDVWSDGWFRQPEQSRVAHGT